MKIFVNIICMCVAEITHHHLNDCDRLPKTAAEPEILQVVACLHLTATNVLRRAEVIPTLLPTAAQSV